MNRPASPAIIFFGHSSRARAQMRRLVTNSVAIIISDPFSGKKVTGGRMPTTGIDNHWSVSLMNTAPTAEPNIVAMIILFVQLRRNELASKQEHSIT